MFGKLAYEWCQNGHHYNVVVRSWKNLDDWKWNIYVILFPGHPKFSTDPNKIQKVMDYLPFHGYCNYDVLVTTSPARGVKYPFQKEITSLKLGCDYQHEYDNYTSCDPADGIPTIIEYDADKLFKILSLDNEKEIYQNT